MKTVKACQEKNMAKTKDINRKQNKIRDTVAKETKMSDFGGSSNFLCKIQIKGQLW